jgi:putative phage-type endonuclease
MEGTLDNCVVSKKEKVELKRLLQQVTTAPNTPTTQLPLLAEPVADIGVAPTPKTSHYIIVELEQGTREWLEWRHKGIGASDAPVVMGENHWKTVAQLLHEKRGRAPREPVQNAAMARGTLLEPEARRRYISKTGRDVRPACLQSSEYEWLRASVDGLTNSGDVVIEIKCGEAVYRKTSQNGCAPDYYYGQLQHILAVTGLQSLDFWCYLPGLPDLLVPVKRDNNYIERMMRLESRFWENVLRSA